MTASGELLNGLDFGVLVPEELSRFRPAIVDGLLFFLGNLPPDRLGEIALGQAALAADAAPEERIAAVARSSPVLHKLGQVIARDPRLPEGLRRRLRGLETLAPSEDGRSFFARVEDELGPLGALGVEPDGEPLAEASVAVVAPFVRADGTRGVFKLLKPGVAERLEDDLALLGRVAARLDARAARHGLPRIDHEATLAGVTGVLRAEVRLENEQANLRRARAAYAATASVVVPRVYPELSTPRLTAMERVFGRPATELDGWSRPARRAFAERIVRALIAGPLWSHEAPAPFHADPHAGNLFVTDDRRLALLDWSLVGRLGKGDRVRLTQALLGGLTADAGRVVLAVAGLAGGAVETGALRRVVVEHLGRLRAGGRPGLAWLTAVLDDAATEAGARFDGDLVLFRKALLTARHVVADVSDDCRIDRVLAEGFALRLGAEWGWRLLAPPFARGFGTHVSNLDLAGVAAAAPLLAFRTLAPGGRA